MLELKNIKKTYYVGENITALKNISINFGPSGFVSVLGPSGCGKTTLLNVIGGLDGYDDGDLVVKGKSTRAFKTPDWDAYRNNCIGFVFQNYNLISHQTILQNVEVALTLSGISKSERKRRAKKALENVGLRDQIGKKPNQLSGGQMQRVAIARALVNDPEIILADEPTGALDSKTSVQIMDILKEISKEKLVIMVTHNAEIAKKYSSRIITMLDGEIESDSAPVSTQEVSQGAVLARFKRTAMSIFAAIGISFGNLKTKKGRTFLTSFAGSIGIIGIALTLAISNGVSSFLKSEASDRLKNRSISIYSQYSSYESLSSAKQEDYADPGTSENFEKYPDGDVVYGYNRDDYKKSSNSNPVHENVITKEYIDYLEKMKVDLKDCVGDIQYGMGTDLNVLGKKSDGISFLKGKSLMYELDMSDSAILEKYDLMGENSRLPKEKDEVILILDEYNRVDDSTREMLGLDKSTSYSFNDLIGKTTLKVITNDEYYVAQGDYFGPIAPEEYNKAYNSKNALGLKVVGVVRPKKGGKRVPTRMIGYTRKLTEYVLKEAINSKIVRAQKKLDVNVLTRMPFKDDKEKEYALRSLNGLDIPESITITPCDVTDSESIEKIKKYLNKYNDGKEYEDKILFEDAMQDLGKRIDEAVMQVTLVLLMFTSVSLIVSSIMIAILTYVSVLERTKEIGILRSVGARKKDVSRLFNAENIIIGFAAGVMGVFAGWLMSIAGNVLTNKWMEGKSLFIVSPVHVVALIALSIGITWLAGFIPAKMASRKKPVEALRTE